MSPKTFKILFAAIVLCWTGFFVTVSTGCGTPPSERVAQVQTLKAVGHTAEAAVALSAQLYRDGVIDAVQAHRVLNIYDLKFQPAYRVAVATVNANLDSIASPDLVALASEIASLVASYQTK